MIVDIINTELGIGTVTEDGIFSLEVVRCIVPKSGRICKSRPFSVYYNA